MLSIYSSISVQNNLPTLVIDLFTRNVIEPWAVGTHTHICWESKLQLRTWALSLQPNAQKKKSKY